MLDAFFWWTGAAMWAGLGVAAMTMLLVEAHDRSILARKRGSS
jgi:hypothetical protein